MHGDFKKEPRCETCPVELISDEDYDIWELYCAINTQFVHDFHALALVFEIHNIQCTRREAKDLLNKLSLIHSWYLKHKKG